jgi:8-oxo-dGTP pyrophosphatase MutT (NUDIX family)
MPSYYRDPQAPTPNVPRRVGVAALIERDGAILVERRADNEADEWAFIGGGLGESETVLEALHREVREETGFAIETATFFGLFSDPTRIVAYPDGNICRVVSVVFRVVPEGSAEPILSHESQEMRFVPFRELATLELWPIHRPIHEALLAGSHGIVVA